MRNFIATNTNDIKEDRARCCKARKEICLSEKMLLLLCCAWTFYFSPVGLRWADVNLAFLGETSREAALSPLLQLWPFLSLNPAICPLAAWVWYPTTRTLLKNNQNLPDSLPQEVAPEMPPWSHTLKGSVIYVMLLEEITHIQNISVKVASTFFWSVMLFNL